MHQMTKRDNVKGVTCNNESTVHVLLVESSYWILYILQDSSQLKDLWKKICHNSTGMEFQDHRYWLRTYPNCIVGKELVNWLLRNGTISTR